MECLRGTSIIANTQHKYLVLKMEYLTILFISITGSFTDLKIILFECP